MATESIRRVKGVFHAPPGNFPTGASTGAAVIGNGDVLAAMGGPPENLTLRLSKLDFWQAREEAGPPGGPAGGARAIGALTLNAPALEGASYLLEQNIHDATIRGRFEKDGAVLCLTAWTPRGENVLVVELQAAGAEAVSIRPAFEIQAGRESVTETGLAGPIAWHERRFEQSNLLWKCAVTVAMQAVDAGAIRLEPGRSHSLVLALATNFDAADHRDRAVALALAMDEPRRREA
ncbi:MAG: hypothetical protein NTV86_03035, partial [Planctomycetota bacterium]|nr:hypothetical protein [Planctomycetota bacterium]